MTSITEQPVSIDFHLPNRYNGPTQIKLQWEDETKLHRQLVCWCCVQRYWYYVLSKPQVNDEEYDDVERYVKELEEECSHLHGNPYSPVGKVGSNRKDDYPAYVRWVFSGMEP